MTVLRAGREEVRVLPVARANGGVAEDPPSRVGGGACVALLRKGAAVRSDDEVGSDGHDLLLGRVPAYTSRGAGQFGAAFHGLFHRCPRPPFECGRYGRGAAVAEGGRHVNPLEGTSYHLL